MSKEELIKFIDEYLKKHSFHKKGLSWYKENPETIIVFSLDRSRWSNQYFIYLCTNFTDLNNDKRPKFYKCHSKLRGESIDGSISEYLDLEKGIDEDIRKERIRQFLEESILIIEQMSNISDFKKLLNKFNPRLFMLGNQTQEFLGVKVN